jgi:O-antigen ligase
LLFLPLQIGKHFWPEFASVSGIRIDYLSPTLYVTDIVVLLLFVTWLFRQTRLTVSGPLGVLFVALVTNVFFSGNPANSFVFGVKLLECVFVGWYVAKHIKTLAQVAGVFFLLALGVLFESVLTVLQWLNQGSLGGIFYYFGERAFSGQTPGIANASIQGQLVLRPYATFPHPNVLAGFLLSVMTGLLFLLPVVSRYQRLVYKAALLIGSSALLLTLSRVAIILWVGMLSFVCLSQVRQVQTKQLVGIVVVLLCLTFVYLSWFTPLGERIFATRLTDESITQRTTLIASSVQLWLHNPIFGVGLGNFIPALATIQKPFSATFYLQPVHNIFLLILVETGLVGFVLGMWGVVKTFIRLFNHIRLNVTTAIVYRLFVMLLLLLCLLGLLDHYWLTLQQGQLLTALLFGLAWSSLSN